MKAKIIINGTLYDCPYHFTSMADFEDEHRCVINGKNKRCDFRNGYGCSYVIPLSKALEDIKNK